MKYLLVALLLCAGCVSRPTLKAPLSSALLMPPTIQNSLPEAVNSMAQSSPQTITNTAQIKAFATQQNCIAVIQNTSFPNGYQIILPYLPRQPATYCYTNALGTNQCQIKKEVVYNGQCTLTVLNANTNEWHRWQIVDGFGTNSVVIYDWTGLYVHPIQFVFAATNPLGFYRMVRDP